MEREREREREREKKGRFGILLHIANTHIIVIVLHLVNDLDVPLE